MISTASNHPLTGIQSLAKSGTTLDVACARLKSVGMRITQPRIAIISALIDLSKPASIEQIFQKLEDKSCDLVTVYRCLAVFEELGLVRRCFFHNGAGLYEFSLNQEARYHIVSRDTNTITPLDADLADDLKQLMTRIQARLESRGYNGVTNMVEIFVNDPANPPDRNKSVVIRTT